MNESEWQIYCGDYEKQFYEVVLTSGRQLKHLWPNAGIFNKVDGSGEIFQGSEVAQVRKCKCGNRYGGCDE